jgi:hypothetical protein
MAASVPNTSDEIAVETPETLATSAASVEEVNSSTEPAPIPLGSPPPPTFTPRVAPTIVALDTHTLGINAMASGSEWSHYIIYYFRRDAPLRTRIFAVIPTSSVDIYYDISALTRTGQTCVVMVRAATKDATYVSDVSNFKLFVDSVAPIDDTSFYAVNEQNLHAGIKVCEATPTTISAMGRLALGVPSSCAPQPEFYSVFGRLANGDSALYAIVPSSRIQINAPVAMPIVVVPSVGSGRASNVFVGRGSAPMAFRPVTPGVSNTRIPPPAMTKTLNSRSYVPAFCGDGATAWLDTVSTSTSDLSPSTAERVAQQVALVRLWSVAGFPFDAMVD